MKHIIFRYCPIIICLLIAFCKTSYAQNNQKEKKEIKRKKDGEIENAEIIIEKNRKIDLPEAERNFEKISSPIKKPEPQPQQYNFVEPVFRLPDLNTRFQLLPAPVENAKTPYSNYVKAGFEPIYAGTYLEGFLNSNRSNNFNYGLHLKHLASANGPIDKQNSAAGEQKVKAFGKYFKDNLLANASLEYNRRQTEFYGYQAGADVKKDSIKQVFNLIDFRTDLKNRILDSLLGYKIAINITNLNDRFSAKEFEFGASVNGDYLINENITALLGLEAYSTKRTDHAGSLNRNLISLKPEIRLKKYDLTIHAGFNLVSQNDTAKALKKGNIYPLIKVDYAVSENFSLYAGIKGEMQRNTLRGLVSENLWLAPDFTLSNTSKTNIYGGFTANIAHSVSLAVNVGSENYKNLYFFINSRTDSTKFDVVYEPKSSKVFHGSIELAYEKNNINFGVKTDFYRYNLTSFKTPYHRPDFTTTVFGKYIFDKKFLFNAEFYYISGLVSLTPDLKDKKLSSIADFNLKAEYLFTDKFSAFVSGNNLFSSKYQRYLYYPVKGIQALLGISYSF